MTDIATDPWSVAATDPNCEPHELERWRSLREKVVAVARRYGWTKSEVSKRSAIPLGTFSQWFDGSYNGVIANQCGRVERWLASVDELSAVAARLPAVPGYVETPSSREIFDALLYAQMSPEMVLIVQGAGMGKTMAVSRYCEEHPHAFLATMRHTTRRPPTMLAELARILEIPKADRLTMGLDQAIGQRLQRNGRQTLLILDEAQNLEDEAVNQVRYFLDVYGVGLALVGNEELYGRFGGRSPKPAYAQLHRRIGLRVRRMAPQPGDIESVVEAWALDDPEVRQLANAIGRKPGALGQLTKTLQLAGMYAAGEQRSITPADVKAALRNRGLEE